MVVSAFVHWAMWRFLDVFPKFSLFLKFSLSQFLLFPRNNNFLLFTYTFTYKTWNNVGNFFSPLEKAHLAVIVMICVSVRIHARGKHFLLWMVGLLGILLVTCLLLLIFDNFVDF